MHAETTFTDANPKTDTYPNSFLAFSGGSIYCLNGTATNLTTSWNNSVCSGSSNGNNTNIPITITWYKNSTNSNTGGTSVQTTTTNAGTTSSTYTPPTTSVGTLYYYVIISWNAGTNCAPAGSITTSTTQTVTVIAGPTVFNVGFTGSLCGTAVVTLDGSETGVNYALQRNGSTVQTVAGTGNPISFNGVSQTGTYTVVATNTTTTCTSNMNGSVGVGGGTPPATFNVTGGGAYCSGGSGVHVGLSGSETGVTYQLYNGLNTVGSPVNGTGSSLDFGIQTAVGTYTVVATKTAGGCTATMSGSATVTINANTSITTDVSSPAAVCAGGTAPTLSVSAVGTNLTYQWYSNTSNSIIGGTSITGATNSSYTPGVSTAGTYYYFVVVHGDCGSDQNSSVATVTVNANTSITTDLTSPGAVCAGGTAPALSVVATGTNLTYKWYSNTTASNTGGTEISGETTSSYTPGVSTAGTYYFYVIVSGDCGSDQTSSVATVTVNANTSITTDVSSPAAVCAGGTAPTLSVSAVGTNLTYQWYSNNSNSIIGGTSITGATNSSYTPDVSTAGTYYYFVVVHGDCGSDQTSSVAKVTVNGLPNNSTASSGFNGSTICYGGTGTLTFDAIDNTFVPPYSIQYTDGTNTWSQSISGASAITFNVAVNPTVTTNYSLVSIANGNGCTRTSAFGDNAAKITVRPQFTAGAISTTGQTICYGGTPGTIGNITAASGGDGNITYSWRSSADGYTTAISGATSLTYTPPAGLTTTTSYQRYANDGTCNTTPTQSTGTWTVTVRLQFTSGAINTTSETICYNTSPTQEIGSATDASGGDGNITYSWRSSADGYTAAIVGATSSTYTPAGPLTATTSYRRYAKDNTCNTTPEQSTGTWTVTVKTLSVAPTSASSSADNFCADAGGTLDLTASGGTLGTGAVVKWYTGSCGGTLVGTGSPLTISKPTTTTTYYALYDGDCNTTTCASVTVTVKTLSVAPASASSSADNFCPGGSANLSVTGGSLGTNASWKWYSGGCGTENSGTLVGTGASILVSPTVTTTYYVRAEGDCNTTDCSSVLVTIKSPTEISGISADKTSWTYGCTTATITVTATGDGTLSYEWHHKYAAGGISDEIVGTNSSTYTVPELAGAGVHEYWVEVTGGCGTVESKHVTITINPQTADALNDGDVYYTGPSVAFTANTTSNTATFTLSAFIKNSDPGNCGDIATARLSFWYRVSGTTPWNKVPNGQSLPVGYADPQNPSKGGTAAVIAQLNIGTGTTQLYDIKVTISGNYQGAPDLALSQITITQPDPAGTISGGARLNNTNSTGYVKGAYKSDIGFFVNFTMKNNKPQNPKGKVNLTVKSYNDRNGNLTNQLHIYNISSNAIASFTISGAKANFTSKANIVEIINCETGETSTIEGNCKLVMDLQDITCGNNSQDLVGIVVYRNAGGIWYSNNYNSNGTTTPAAIYCGDIDVSGSGVCNISSVVNSQSTNSIMEQPLEIIPFSVKAFPNPTARSFNLLVNGDATQIVQIKVFDISGKQVYVNRGAANRLYQFGEHFFGGTYFIVVEQGDKRTTTKVVKQ